MQIRGVSLDHSTILRWVYKFAPKIERNMHQIKYQVGDSCRMDETCIKVGREDRFLYRALDKEGNTVDLILTKRRQKMSTQKFFNKAIVTNGSLGVVNIYKSGTNKMAIWAVTKRALSIKKIKIRQCKYLNNIVEQDHRNIKRRIGICTGFKAFISAHRALSGIEVVSVIRKN
jgi:putative transposase